MIDLIGWVATAIFAVSYFFTSPLRLRLIQAFAALLWLSYGILIKAPPVIAANFIVAVLALSSAFKKRQPVEN